MKAAKIQAQQADPYDIPLQPASYDIWDKKYRLKTKAGEPVDQDTLGTFTRIARALADVEDTPEKRTEWFDQFLWALLNGAIPAGRITSNAGALDHKPATSTINCTVSGIVCDSMDGILSAVHEAGLTLKAGCVAPETKVVTEYGVVTAERAVTERHERMLCYDRETGSFEMRRIDRHMTTHVPRNENIEIRSGGTALKTSIRHPVLVYRDDQLIYVRADEVCASDAMVHHTFAWLADENQALRAWFAGTCLGDGGAHGKRFERGNNHATWVEAVHAAGRRIVFRVRAAEREVAERCAAFFHAFCGFKTQFVATATEHGTPVWDFTVTGLETSRMSELIDGPIGGESVDLRVPTWVAAHPDRYFLPFLAGLIDADGTVNPGHGVTISMHNQEFAEQIKGLLGLFGVHGAIVVRESREQDCRAHASCNTVGSMLRIIDSTFLTKVAGYMAHSGKRGQIGELSSREAGQHDRYHMPSQLMEALSAEIGPLNHEERQALGFYHGYHRKRTVSRIWLDRWSARFPRLRPLIDFVRTLRPVEAVRRNLNIAETFYDFTVEKHHNYLAGENGLMVIHNCGIGYEFSTLRPKGAFVNGAGAHTSGPLSFMDIFNAMCFTVSSAGGRRGAQMGTFDISHPDVAAFIRAKREDGRLRQFNLSCLITDEFMQAVKDDATWDLAFPANQLECDQATTRIVWRPWPTTQGYVTNDLGQVACKIYKTLPARRLWDLIMASTYDYAEPGFILIDRINEMNNNWFCENIRATNPCGEQPLPPYGSCLLGSVNLTKFIESPFTAEARFDWDRYRRVVMIFTRMLDNVVEINGLPLAKQREEITRKRRHGMGFLGLGSAMTMLRMTYGDPESLAFTERVAREMAEVGWETGIALAEEKGPAPILIEDFAVTAEMLDKRPEMKRDGYKIGDKVPGKVLLAKYSRYMQKFSKALTDRIAETGVRFTHHTSIAPTGTISLSLANNASNGIEPSFAHQYSRNVIREGRKTKEKIDVYSYELLAYRTLVNPKADPNSQDPETRLPDYFVSADNISPRQHVDVQAAAQKWVDSSISKTANVPTDFPYEEFKDIYMYAYEQGLKGCTTFRFNPQAFQGVLVKEKDLEKTTYRFQLEGGEVIEAKGNEEIEYDGEIHTAANLYDALKEGYYGKF